MTLSHALWLAFAALAAAGNAIADDITIDPNPFVSTASRAQVQEELRQNRMAGVHPLADDYNPLSQFRSTLTREQVVAEFHHSRGVTTAFSGEDSGSTYLAQMNAPHTQRATLLARSR